MQLAQLQQRISDAIINDSDVSDIVCSTDRLSAKQRIAIYRDSILEAQIAALKENYPVVYELIGEECWQQVAQQYVNEHPSQSVYLFEFGRNFPTFINKLEQLSALPYLSDVAKLEWHWQAALFGPDAQSIDIQALTELPQSRLIFRLQPNATLVNLQYPADSIWQWHHDPATPLPRIERGDIHLLIWRVNDEVMMERLETNTAQFLTACSDGLNLTEIAEQMGDALCADQLAHWLSHGINSGWFASAEINTA